MGEACLLFIEMTRLNCIPLTQLLIILIHRRESSQVRLSTSTSSRSVRPGGNIKIQDQHGNMATTIKFLLYTFPAYRLRRFTDKFIFIYQ